MSGPFEAVRQRARNRCEYCHLPQEAFRRGFHIEHIVARQHGGSTSLSNLALACWNCNRKKGPNLSGIDPATLAVRCPCQTGRHPWPVLGALDAVTGPLHTWSRDGRRPCRQSSCWSCKYKSALNPILLKKQKQGAYGPGRD
ncbi:MAG: HNH endonuclease signature motif containing protein [Bryobacteraceae bacterium]